MSETKASVVTRIGRIVERSLGGASKQARRGPVLETADGDVQVYVIGDNPFSPSQLSGWLEQRVEVTGSWRGDTLRVEASDVRSIADTEPATDTKPATDTEPSTVTDAEAGLDTQAAREPVSEVPTTGAQQDPVPGPEDGKGTPQDAQVPPSQDPLVDAQEVP